MADKKTANVENFYETTWSDFGYAVHDETMSINKSLLKENYRNKDENRRGEIAVACAAVGGFAAMSAAPWKISDFTMTNWFAISCLTTSAILFSYSIARRNGKTDPLHTEEVEERSHLKLDLKNNEENPNSASKILILDTAQDMLDHTKSQIEKVGSTQNSARIIGTLYGVASSIFLIPIVKDIALHVSGPNAAAAGIAAAFILPTAYGYSHFNKKLQNFKKEAEFFTKKLDVLQRWADHANDKGLKDKLPEGMTHAHPIKVDASSPDDGVTVAPEIKIDTDDAIPETIAFVSPDEDNESGSALTPGPTPAKSQGNPLTPGSSTRPPSP